MPIVFSTASMPTSWSAIRDGEEADRAHAEHERRYRDERVGGVEVAAEQEPGDPGAELAAAETPLVQVVEPAAALPARRHEPEHRHQQEERDDDDELDDLEVALHLTRASSCGTRSW
jgi:hypothetical protein